MKRALLPVLLLAMVFLVLPAGLAMATAPTQVSVDTAFCSIDCESKDVYLIVGTITCTVGEAFFLRANIRQFGQTVAVGRASGTCTGSLQEWETNRVDNPNFADCSSAASFRGSGTAGGTKFTIPPFAFGPPAC